MIVVKIPIFPFRLNPTLVQKHPSCLATATISVKGNADQMVGGVLSQNLCTGILNTIIQGQGHSVSKSHLGRPLFVQELVRLVDLHVALLESHHPLLLLQTIQGYHSC